MSTIVRVPNVDDADAMAEVHKAAWQAGYVGVMPAEFLAGLDSTRLSTNWARMIAKPDEGVTNLVAELDNVIRAICTVGPFRDRSEDDDPSGELHRINCHPDAFGTGLATALHAVGINQLRTDGHHRAALWVVEQNPRARRFYEREGWAVDQTTKTGTHGDAEIVEVSYSISL